MEAAGVPAASYMMRRAPAWAGSRIVGRWNAAPPQTPVPLTKSKVARRQAVRSPRQATPDHTKKEVLTMIKIAPSILSADFANLERDIRRIDTADYVHVDVMDGLFVPNITIGIPVVKSIRPTTALPLDVHRMIDRPVRYVEEFCRAGADIVTVHVEADTQENTRKALEHIRGPR